MDISVGVIVRISDFLFKRKKNMEQLLSEGFWGNKNNHAFISVLEKEGEDIPSSLPPIDTQVQYYIWGLHAISGGDA